MADEDTLQTSESLKKELWKVPVDLELINDKEIGHSELRLYLVLLSYARMNKTCFPKIETLAEQLGVSVRHIHTLKDDLKEHGLIDWEQYEWQGRTHNKYILKKYKPIQKKQFNGPVKPTSSDQGSKVQAKYTNHPKYTNEEEERSSSKQENKPDSPRDIQDIAIDYYKSHPEIDKDILEIVTAYYQAARITKNISANDINTVETSKPKFVNVKSHLDRVLEVWNEYGDDRTNTIAADKRYIGTFVKHGLLDKLEGLVEDERLRKKVDAESKEYFQNGTSPSIKNHKRLSQVREDIAELLASHPEEVPKIAKKYQLQLADNWEECIQTGSFEWVFGVKLEAEAMQHFKDLVKEYSRL